MRTTLLRIDGGSVDTSFGVRNSLELQSVVNRLGVFLTLLCSFAVGIMLFLFLKRKGIR